MPHTCYTVYLCILVHAAVTVVQHVCAVISSVCNVVRRNTRTYTELLFERDPIAASVPLKSSDEYQSHNRVPRDRSDQESCQSL